ncbi:hypothetical protein AB0C40_06890 [Streptomyces brevispora]
MATDTRSISFRPWVTEVVKPEPPAPEALTHNTISPAQASNGVVCD